MKKKTKKIIGLSFVISLVVALLAWHLIPILTVKWFIRANELQIQMKIIPIQINILTAPPSEWDDINVDQLSFKLPLSRYKKIIGKESFMSFISDTGSIVVYLPMKEIQAMIRESKYVTYQQILSIAYSTPTDISFFNLPNRNMNSMQFLVLKAISAPAAGGLIKMLHVDTGNLKALCTVSKGNEKGLTARADVYSQNETAQVSFNLIHYKDKGVLEADLLAILGGIKIPDHTPNPEVIRDDIVRIVAKHNKT